MTRALLPSLIALSLLLASAPSRAETAAVRARAVVQALRVAKQAPRGTVVLASEQSRFPIQVGARKGQLTQQKQLVLEGKRAYIELTTSSRLLFGSPSVSRIAVPTGRLLGWWGSVQVRSHFPELTAAQIKARLGSR